MLSLSVVARACLGHPPLAARHFSKWEPLVLPLFARAPVHAVRCLAALYHAGVRPSRPLAVAAAVPSLEQPALREAVEGLVPHLPPSDPLLLAVAEQFADAEDGDGRASEARFTALRVLAGAAADLPAAPARDGQPPPAYVRAARRGLRDVLTNRVADGPRRAALAVAAALLARFPRGWADDAEFVTLVVTAAAVESRVALLEALDGGAAGALAAAFTAVEIVMGALATHEDADPHPWCALPADALLLLRRRAADAADAAASFAAEPDAEARPAELAACARLLAAWLQFDEPAAGGGAAIVRALPALLRGDEGLALLAPAMPAVLGGGGAVEEAALARRAAPRLVGLLRADPGSEALAAAVDAAAGCARLPLADAAEAARECGDGREWEHTTQSACACLAMLRRAVEEGLGFKAERARLVEAAPEPRGRWAGMLREELSILL